MEVPFRPRLGWQTNYPLLLQQPGQFLRQYRLPLLILAIGSLADAVTTIDFLRHFGVDSELHPAQRWVAQLLGVIPGVTIAKLIQVVGAVLVACIWRRWTAGLLTICGALYFMASLSNHFHWLDTATF